MKKIDPKYYIDKLLPLLHTARKYFGFIGIMLILAALGYIILQIRSYANVEPSESAINEKLKGLQAAKLDQEALEKVQKLESTNVTVKALFEEARDNPFQE